MAFWGVGVELESKNKVEKRKVHFLFYFKNYLVTFVGWHFREWEQS